MLDKDVFMESDETMDELSMYDRKALQDELLDLFHRYGVHVAVGLTKTGVAVRSQDERVDLLNIGIPVAHPATADDLVAAVLWRSGMGKLTRKECEHEAQRIVAALDRLTLVTRSV